MSTNRQASPTKRFLMLRVVPTLALALLRSLHWSWRIRETGREHLDEVVSGPEPAVLAFFHGRTFALLRYFSAMPDARWVSMCSKSLDGEAMAQVEERLGLDVVRGSSGRDGLQAIQEMIRRVRRQPGCGAALAVDGSRGPRGRVQGGVVRMARWTGGRIVPVTASARPARIFRRAWDRTLLPWPFARVDVVFGEPIDVPGKLDAQQAEALRLRVEDSMVRLQESADEQAGFGDDVPALADV